MSSRGRRQTTQQQPTEPTRRRREGDEAGGGADGAQWRGWIALAKYITFEAVWLVAAWHLFPVVQEIFESAGYVAVADFMENWLSWIYLGCMGVFFGLHYLAEWRRWVEKREPLQRPQRRNEDTIATDRDLSEDFVHLFVLVAYYRKRLCSAYAAYLTVSVELQALDQREVELLGQRRALEEAFEEATHEWDLQGSQSDTLVDSNDEADGARPAAAFSGFDSSAAAWEMWCRIEGVRWKMSEDGRYAWQGRIMKAGLRDGVALRESRHSSGMAGVFALIEATAALYSRDDATPQDCSPCSKADSERSSLHLDLWPKPLTLPSSRLPRAGPPSETSTNSIDDALSAFNAAFTAAVSEAQGGARKHRLSLCL